jgi:hypothetical protein
VPRPALGRAGVERFEGLARDFVGRHQAVRDEQRHETVTAPQIAVAPPPRAARNPSIDGIRCLGFRIAPVGINAHAAGAEALRVTVLVEPDDEPTERIGADVKPETVW